MNVIDTSAVIAILFGEAGSEEIERKLMGESAVMSAATRVELGIVVEARRGPTGTQLLEELLHRSEVEIVELDENQAIEALVGWRRFGKGRHPAGLNLGDTYSYALAIARGGPLLFVGNDFSQTDVEVA